MPDLADPRPDYRYPGYGCTLSYGMKGPSRILLSHPEPAVWYDELVDGVLVPHFQDFFGEPDFRSIWTGATDQALYLVQLGTSNPETGIWLMDVLLNSLTSADTYAWQQVFTNFRWNGFVFQLQGLVEPVSWLSLSAPREWMDVRTIAPDVTIAEVF